MLADVFFHAVTVRKTNKITPVITPATVPAIPLPFPFARLSTNALTENKKITDIAALIRMRHTFCSLFSSLRIRMYTNHGMTPTKILGTKQI